MTNNRPARIWSLVAEQAASHGGRVSAADACVAAVAAVEVTGARRIAVSGAAAGHPVQVTDEVSEMHAGLQDDAEVLLLLEDRLLGSGRFIAAEGVVAPTRVLAYPAEIA